MQDSERSKSTASRPGQYIYLLEAIDSVEEGGYPAQVIVTSSTDLDWDVDRVVKTQHAEVRKNLPDRRVVGIVFPTGEEDGVLAAEGVSLPHWECIRAKENGAPDTDEINRIKMRILDRRNLEKAQKEAARSSKRLRAS
jgi:hypothetical protein